MARAPKVDFKPATVWKLSDLLARFPGGYLLLRQDSKKKVVESLFVAPILAKDAEPGKDASSAVVIWSQRVAAIHTKTGPLRCSVAFFPGSTPLTSWEPLTLSRKEALGL